MSYLLLFLDFWKKYDTIKMWKIDCFTE